MIYKVRGQVKEVDAQEKKLLSLLRNVLKTYCQCESNYSKST